MNLEPINTRLAAFASSVGDKPPEAILRHDGSPSAALMDFRKRHGLTLDWMVTGEGPQFRQMDPTAAAYRVNHMLRIIALACESDTGGAPGDDMAIAEVANIARNYLAPVIDALEFAENHQTPPMDGSSPATLYARWKDVKAQMAALVDAEGGDDPETIEFAALSEQLESLSQRIGSATPQTDTDAAAISEWFLMDSEGTFMCDLYVQAHQNVLSYLKGGLDQ